MALTATSERNIVTLEGEEGGGVTIGTLEGPLLITVTVEVTTLPRRVPGMDWYGTAQSRSCRGGHRDLGK